MGNSLFTKVTSLTGLPEDLIGNELRELLDKKGTVPEECTMDSLRTALQDYLKEVNAQMLAEGNFAPEGTGEAIESTAGVAEDSGLESAKPSDELTQ